MPLISTAQSVPTPDDDTLVIAINGEPGSMDPAQVGGSTGGSNFRIMMHTFATLYELGQASGAIDPYLAHSFTVSEDGTEWTFHMHEGLTCDDGEPRGGLFVWADSSSTGIHAAELSYLLLQEGRVLIFPGTAFGERWREYVRITMLEPIDTLREAVSRMLPVIERYRV